MENTNIIAELEKAIIEAIKTEPDRPPNTPINESDVPIIIHAALGGLVRILLDDIAAGRDDRLKLTILATASALCSYK